jgi:hypothetical protein
MLLRLIAPGLFGRWTSSGTEALLKDMKNLIILLTAVFLAAGFIARSGAQTATQRGIPGQSGMPGDRQAGGGPWMQIRALDARETS